MTGRTRPSFFQSLFSTMLRKRTRQRARRGTRASTTRVTYVRIVSQAIMRLTSFDLPGGGCSVLSLTKSST